MATFSAIRFVLAAALLITLVPASLASGDIPKSVCYTKTQRCCFKYSLCGTITKNVRRTRDCPYKKCRKFCKPVCHYVPKRVSFKHCYKAYRRTYVCKRVKSYTKKGYVWTNVCHPKYVSKDVCVKKYRYIRKKICKKRCYKICKIVKAICIYYRVYSFPKYCAKLSCYKPVIRGDTTAPKDVVGKKGKFVKIIKGKRISKH